MHFSTTNSKIYAYSVYWLTQAPRIGQNERRRDWRILSPEWDLSIISFPPKDLACRVGWMTVRPKAGSWLYISCYPVMGKRRQADSRDFLPVCWSVLIGPSWADEKLFQNPRHVASQGLILDVVLSSSHWHKHTWKPLPNVLIHNAKCSWVFSKTNYLEWTNIGVYSLPAKRSTSLSQRTKAKIK